MIVAGLPASMLHALSKRSDACTALPKSTLVDDQDHKQYEARASQGLTKCPLQIALALPINQSVSPLPCSWFTSSIGVWVEFAHLFGKKMTVPADELFCLKGRAKKEN